MKMAKNQLTHVEIVSDHEHRRITTCSLAFDLNNGELAVFRRLPRLDPTEVFAYSVENFSRPAKHARGRRADLHKVLADRFPNL